MLFFMGSARHLALVNQETPAYGAYLVAAFALILLVELNAFMGPAATQKPLGSVSGTLYSGFGLTLVLFLLGSRLL